MFKQIFGKIIFPFAIIGGIAGVALSIAAMSLTMDGFSVWDMVAHSSGVRKVDLNVQMATYGAIVCAFVSMMAIISGVMLYREEFVTHKIRFLLIITAYILTAFVIIFGAILMESAVHVTDANWLKENGMQFIPSK